MLKLQTSNPTTDISMTLFKKKYISAPVCQAFMKKSKLGLEFAVNVYPIYNMPTENTAIIYHT